MLRIICSGTRHATEAHREEIGAVLWEYARRDVGVLAHGAARGVDSIAASLAEAWEWKPYPVPALWSDCDLTVPQELGGCPDWDHVKTNHGGRYCPYAGRRRNQRLVDLKPRANWVIAFPAADRKSTGTADLIKRARRAGLTVIEHLLHTSRSTTDHTKEN